MREHTEAKLVTNRTERKRAKLEGALQMMMRERLWQLEPEGL